MYTQFSRLIPENFHVHVLVIALFSMVLLMWKKTDVLYGCDTGTSCFFMFSRPADFSIEHGGILPMENEMTGYILTLLENYAKTTKKIETAAL